MNSSTKKRREATQSQESDSMNGDTIEGAETAAKRPCLSPESTAKIEAEAPTNDFDDLVLNRTPLKVALKRVGKRDHGVLESPFKHAADESVAEYGTGEGSGGPPRKVARASPALQSPSSSRAAHMASNLRTSLRGSAGSSGLKQVKKLVVKSTLGTHWRLRTKSKALPFASGLPSPHFPSFGPLFHPSSTPLPPLMLTFPFP